MTQAEIIGFSKKRSRGKVLPVLRFEDESTVEITSRAVVIDSLGFWIKPAIEGEVIDILYFKKNSEKCIVPGYMNILGAFFLQWPLLFYFSANYFGDLAQGQFGFLFILFSVVALMWLFLRLVRFYY